MAQNIVVLQMQFLAEFLICGHRDIKRKVENVENMYIFFPTIVEITSIRMLHYR